MDKELKNYGYDEVLQEVKAYILGDGNVPFIPYQPDGNWEPYLPKYEAQAQYFETYCCTVFGTENCVETLHKRLYGEEPNYSDRFTSIRSGLTGNAGTDPQIPCESIRHDGLVNQEVMPMTTDKDEFFDSDRITDSILAKGQNWLYKHDFRHEWVWRGSRPGNYMELLKESLKTSPLGVSVCAWYEENGVFVSKGDGNNHWCMLYKIDDEGYPWVFDSYDHSKKRLSRDHNIRRAKRFHLQTRTKPAMKLHIKILQIVLDFLSQKKT